MTQLEEMLARAEQLYRNNRKTLPIAASISAAATTLGIQVASVEPDAVIEHLWTYAVRNEPSSELQA